jgi:ketosteroid isomerase-like protein
MPKCCPPDATEVAGRDAIQKVWQSWIDDGLKDLTLEAVDVEADGDHAYEIGKFSMQVPAENNTMATATGNYLMVWKRAAAGDWQQHVDTWNEAPAQ